jgi:calcineurin-like phosphoesterase family protein
MIGKWIFAYMQEKSVRYYIADLHFYHENLNQHMDCRGFESADAMNEYMIARWNSRVRKNDEVVILGDFSISPNGSEVNRILERLQGKKFLIRGNHERYLESRKFDPGHFGWIEDYKELRDNKRKVVLSHYPIMCYNGQYRVHDSGEPITYMLYGHVHNSFDEWLINEYVNKVQASKTVTRDSSEAVPIPCRMINCFCMFSDYVPLTLDEWIRVDEARRSVLNGAG